MIVLDTCVLSEAFRKHRHTEKSHRDISKLRQMILDDWAIVIPGIVLQEFLTAFKTSRHFENAHEVTSGFTVALADEDDHVLAARVRSACASKGIAAATIDCLIAAMTINRNSYLFTFDRDFHAIAKICHLKLFDV